MHFFELCATYLLTKAFVIPKLIRHITPHITKSLHIFFLNESCGCLQGDDFQTRLFPYSVYQNPKRRDTKHSVAGTNFQASYDTNNRLTMIGSVVPTYDANGNLQTDGYHIYTWNVAGRPVTVDTLGLTYDAFGRMVEKNNAGVTHQFVYQGSQKLAQMAGQSQTNAYVPLPGGTQGVYVSGTLNYYAVPDCQGLRGIRRPYSTNHQ